MKICSFIALGSNVGDRQGYLEKAVRDLEATPGIFRVKMSPVYETDPVGGPSGQGKYLNAAAEIETSLSPRDLLSVLLDIEKRLGRVRTLKDAPRTIDLDLILYGDQVINEPDLKVPHPRFHERWFVLTPLSDIASEWVHPVLHKSILELLKMAT